MGRSDGCPSVFAFHNLVTANRRIVKKKLLDFDWLDPVARQMRDILIVPVERDV